MNRQKNSIKSVAIISLVFVVLIITLSVLYAARDDGEQPSVKKAEAITLVPEEVPFKCTTGLLIAVSPELSIVSFLDISSNQQTDYSYTGSTDIRDSYDKVIAAAQLQTGDYVDVYTDKNGRLMRLIKSNASWEYKNVGNLIIDKSLKKMTVGKTIYRYNDSLRITSQNKFISLTDLNINDRLCITGINNYIYLINVVSGHGYLTLSNYSDFIGGAIYIGNDFYAQITDNFRLTLPEGSHTVRVENEELKASADIEISRDTVFNIDLKEYIRSEKPQGHIYFTVFPEGAELFIDNKLTLYDAPVELQYGEYTIETILGGYISYKGTLSVNSETSYISITLSPTPPEEEQITPVPLPSFTPEETDGEILTPTIIPDKTDEVSPDPSTVPDDMDDDITPDPSTAPDDMEDDITPAPSATPDDMEDDITPDPSTAPDDMEETDTVSESHIDGFYIILRCNNGARVYINNELAGTIIGGQLKCPKKTGELSIRLELDGYITKYYSVLVENDAEDVTLSFPDMVKNLN